MSFRRTFIIVNLMILLSLLLLGSNTVFAKSFFWKVHSDTATVYLLGSIHLGKPDFYPLTGNIESAFLESSILALEINPDTIDQASMQAVMQEKGYYSGDDSLQEHVDRETFNLFKNYVDQNQLPFSSLVKMKPGLLSMTLSIVAMNKLGFRADLGIDRYFLNKAKTKKVLELETYQQQLDLFFNLPAEEWYLRYTLEQLDTIGIELEKISNAWKTGNAERLEYLMIDEIQAKFPQLKLVHDKLFTQRNLNMSKKIDGYLKTDKTYFVVVGAGHLVGNQGIIALLAKRGYTVEQK